MILCVFFGRRTDPPRCAPRVLRGGPGHFHRLTTRLSIINISEWFRMSPRPYKHPMQLLSMYTPHKTTTKSSQVIHYPPRSELHKKSPQGQLIRTSMDHFCRDLAALWGRTRAWGHQKSSKHDDIAYDVSIEVLETVKDPRGARTGRTAPDPAPAKKTHTLCIH